MSIIKYLYKNDTKLTNVMEKIIINGSKLVSKKVYKIPIKKLLIPQNIGT